MTTPDKSSTRANRAQQVSEFAASEPEAFAAISRIVSEELEKSAAKVNSPEYAARLRAQFSELTSEKLFEVGMLVKWKKGLKNKRRPQYGEPAIVVAIDTGLLDLSSEAGSSYFREPIDLSIGMLDQDGELSVFHVDSRRFDHYELD